MKLVVFGKKIWRANLHKRLKLFLWRVNAKVLPTRKIIAEKTGRGEISCVVRLMNQFDTFSWSALLFELWPLLVTGVLN